MNLATRIKRMETKRAAQPCPGCAPSAGLFLFDDEPEPAKADPCPLCRRERYRMADGTITRPWIIMHFVFGA